MTTLSFGRMGDLGRRADEAGASQGSRIGSWKEEKPWIGELENDRIVTIVRSTRLFMVLLLCWVSDLYAVRSISLAYRLFYRVYNTIQYHRNACFMHFFTRKV